jgi:hypothetical protein
LGRLMNLLVCLLLFAVHGEGFCETSFISEC